MSRLVILCLFFVAASAASPSTREERLRRRQQSAAYKRARSNLDLQFIAEFMKLRPLTSPPATPSPVEFDPSGLLEETQFSLWWLLKGLFSPSEPRSAATPPASQGTRAFTAPVARLTL